VGRAHDCDLLLDQNIIGGREALHAESTPPSAVVLSGPRYALLRPEFARLRSGLPRSNNGTRPVLICFGGADPRDHTSAAVEALAPLAESLHVTVVLGPANRNAAAVERACRRLSDHDLNVAPPDFAAILSKSGLAIGAGGVMAWERACLGVPAVAFGIAPNQVRGLEYLFDAGCAVGIAELFEPDVEAIRSCLSAALRNPAMLAGMARRAAEIVDGNGASRVADLMMPATVTFRAARMTDSEMIFNWRNHPAIRSVSRDTAEIPAEVHRRWMDASMRNPGRALLVAECGSEPVGIVRFDFDGDTARISVYRAPESERRRIGLIPHAVEWLGENRPDIRRIVAEVMAGNAASQSAFESAGFVEKERVLEKELSR
jgi:spore coat polysaccharide biosynthesis predicted glycosyltransferase SpsG/RimJ/RimL family protein N-acetyltransferase